MVTRCVCDVCAAFKLLYVQVGGTQTLPVLVVLCVSFDKLLYCCCAGPGLLEILLQPDTFRCLLLRWVL